MPPDDALKERGRESSTIDAICSQVLNTSRSYIPDPTRATILKKHIARIDDPRLRRAFQAAVDLERESRALAGENKRQDLWTACDPGPGLSRLARGAKV